MTARLTRDDVTKVALLGRLKLSAEELERMTSQLGRVLEYVDILNEVDTQSVEPLAHPIELANVFREDVERPCLSREEALANAPKTDGRCFVVPAILDGTSN
jgi:aspartyl-tRNA(Asn)/glutamyl-tRNA(Gln) amidotransferase subunit C